MRFAGKVVIVTGGARGIGRRIANAFHREGAHIVIADTLPQGEQTATELSSDGKTAFFVRSDVSKALEVSAIVEAAITRYRRLDVVINNAGIMRNGLTPILPIEDWQAVIDVCLSATFYMAKYAAPYITKARNGSMISIASIHGLQGAAGWAPYEAAKGGLISLVRALAAEFGPSGVRVNAISPGWIVTPENESRLPKLPPHRYALHQMLRRPGLADEIADAALFLASDNAAFITGHNLVVDGGTSAWLCEDQLRSITFSNEGQGSFRHHKDSLAKDPFEN